MAPRFATVTLVQCTSKISARQFQHQVAVTIKLKLALKLPVSYAYLTNQTLLQAESIIENIGYPDYIMDAKYLADQYKDVCNIVCLLHISNLPPLMSKIDLVSKDLLANCFRNLAKKI